MPLPPAPSPLVALLQRAFRLGPKHGTARGMALHGPGGPQLRDRHPALLQPEELPRLLAERGQEFGFTPACLAATETAIGIWQQDPETASPLGNEVGLLLGGVLVEEIPGARWALWPNGHPVVQLPTGQEVDVLAIATTRASRGHPALAEVLAKARRISQPEE